MWDISARAIARGGTYFFEDVRDFGERVLRQVLEYGHTERGVDIISDLRRASTLQPSLSLTHSPLEEVRVLGLPDEARTHHYRLEALSLDGPELAVGGSCEETVHT